jgi:hypothetical protein
VSPVSTQQRLRRVVKALAMVKAKSAVQRMLAAGHAKVASQRVVNIEVSNTSSFY